MSLRLKLRGGYFSSITYANENNNSFSNIASKTAPRGEECASSRSKDKTTSCLASRRVSSLRGFSLLPVLTPLRSRTSRTTTKTNKRNRNKKGRGRRAELQGKERARAALCCANHDHGPCSGRTPTRWRRLGGETRPSSSGRRLSSKTPSTNHPPR